MKDLARTVPLDFTIPHLLKKRKSDSFSNYKPSALRNTRFRSSFFYSTIMPPPADKESDNISASSSTKSSRSDNDDLDSLLDRLENLNFQEEQDESIKHNEKQTKQLFEIKKVVLHTICEHKIDTSEFDELYDDTEVKTKKETVKPLTAQENQLVDKVLRKGQRGTVSQFNKATVEYHDVYKLYPKTWLNDEIVNFYFELLSDRASKQKSELPAIHCFSTFFCSTLRDQGYGKVKRWTKRVDIFEKDLLLIPINQSYHWVLGVIDMKNKAVIVYDSLAGNHDYTLSLFISYLEQEHMDKKKTPLDTSDWKRLTPKDIPQQGNSSDCGAFTCTFAERLSRRETFNFSQDDMVVIRRRMVLNILNKFI